MGFFVAGDRCADRLPLDLPVVSCTMDLMDPASDLELLVGDLPTNGPSHSSRQSTKAERVWLRATIAGVMKLTAIIALSLAMLRFVPMLVLEIPIFVFLIVLIELALLQASFRRPLRHFSTSRSWSSAFC